MSETPRSPCSPGPSISPPSLRTRSSFELVAERHGILALRRAPALVPGLEFHPPLELVDVASVAVVDGMAVRERLVPEPLGDAQRRDVVGREGRPREARVDHV